MSKYVEMTHDQVIDACKSYMNDEQVAFVEKAYEYAENAHSGQKRASGQPYIIHPTQVAGTLATLGLDPDTVAAGFLHDTVEDTPTTNDDIKNEFGEDVAFIVDGVTKLNKYQYKSHQEFLAENHRKMLIAMAKDLRVIMVKLADRLHNMHTLQHLRPDKQRRISSETMDIYAPLADRLGIAWIKWELEDRAFRILNPEMYYEIHHKVKMKRGEREEYLSEVKDIISLALQKANIEGEISGRPKHFYSIYSKMIKKGTSFEDIFDLLALRVIVNTKSDCYSSLGIIHSLWTPIPHRIKDYIANPKANMYQSIHTTVMGPGGMMVEFQIRTRQMHKIAEEGVAAHWAYKEGRIFNPKEDKQFAWLRHALEDNNKEKSPTEFVNAIKEDVFREQIFVFTPHGHVVELPVDSTPIDFAYAIHSQVGHTCVGAKINGRIAPLKVKLNSGDKVEILTSQTQEPRKDWLNIVKTNRAYSRISAFLRKKDTEKAILTGREILNKEFKHSGLDFEEIISDKQDLKKALDKFSVHSLDELITHVGFGQISARKLLHLFLPDIREEEIDVVKQVINRKLEPFKISGVDNMMIKTAKCCSPLPGDAIKGYVSTGRGIIVHKADCPNITRLEENKDRIVDVEWDNSDKLSMPVKYKAILEDISGVFVEISTIIKDMGLNIHEMNIKNYGNGTAKMEFVVMVKNKKQSDMLSEKICSNKHVISVKQS